MVTSLQQTRVETSVCPADSQIEKIQQDAENAKTELIQQKMEVVSNTMSEKDCEEMGRDGFSVNGTEVETIVTEIDKIKMELGSGNFCHITVLYSYIHICAPFFLCLIFDNTYFG